MLQIQVQSRIVQRMIKMADGRLALVHFLVYLENGSVKAKMLSVKYSEVKVDNTKPIAICGNCGNQETIPFVQKFHKSIVSPYKELLFFISQPTRAPNFA